MKDWTAPLIAHMAGAETTMTRMWLSQRVDGTINAFTEHDCDMDFDLEAAIVARGRTPPPGIEGTGTQTYKASTGFTASDISTSAGMNVDTGEAQGVLVSPAITEAAMRAGAWDDAIFTIFEVNWNDKTMGVNILRYGTIGDIVTDLGFFRATWRGLMEAYQAMVCELTSPYCRANLFDARCGVDPAPYTKTGTLTGVATDKVTLYDTSRTEPGPTGGIAILSVTNANPGKVTMASAGTFNNGDPVVIAGSRGMTMINTTTIMRGLSGATWTLPIDTSDTSFFPAYTGGGTVSPLGGGAGYFGYGLVTFTSGLNAGLSMEIKVSDVGLFVLQLPMPYTCAIGDTYSIKAGCDKSRNTCRDTFSNIVNMRAEPFSSGNDKMAQIARTT